MQRLAGNSQSQNMYSSFNPTHVSKDAVQKAELDKLPSTAGP